MSEIVRYRAKILIPPGEGSSSPAVILAESGSLHARRNRALNEGIEMAVKLGVVVVEEVPVQRKTKTEYVEVKGDGKT